MGGKAWYSNRAADFCYREVIFCSIFCSFGPLENLSQVCSSSSGLQDAIREDLRSALIRTKETEPVVGSSYRYMIDEKEQS